MRRIAVVAVVRILSVLAGLTASNARDDGAPCGDSLAGIKVGEKVTVTRGNSYGNGIITAVTEDGRTTSRYAFRFGR